jgi:hypothetical protein
VEENFRGWPNRETWALHLWLTNEERLYHQALIVAAADELKEWVVDELWPGLFDTVDGRVMMEDVGSLWRVDWKRVTDALRE